MSDWPIASDYSNMMQNPQVAFREAGLKTCTVERDPTTRQPVARAGAFANVYKGTRSDGSDVAIRVFTTRSGEMARERYAAISDYLNSLNGDRPTSLVGFEFAEKGIRVASCGGKWFPLVTMEWVPGDTLFDWVRAKCRDRAAQELGTAAEGWVDLVNDLGQARIAHGDLQHGNVMVTPTGQLKLVDYDCMCVPSLIGAPNLEIGVEPYQHRERDENTLLYEGLDNFSALFILVALRALSASTDLWFQFNETSAELYDKLLFRKEDFDSPHTSALFSSLKGSPDEKLRRWTETLFELWRGPMKDVPPLIEIASDIDSVVALLSEKAFDDALRLLSPQNAPPEIQPALLDAETRVKCRKKLEKAVENGDEQAMVQLYDPGLLDDYPLAADAVSQARTASKVLPILDQLQQAQQAHQWRDFVRLWDSQQSILSGRVSAAGFERDVFQWRDRNAACDTVLQFLNAPSDDVTSLREAWLRLKQLGGHPEADHHQTTVQNLIQRHDALDKLRALPTAATLQNDQALLAAWDDTLFKGWDEAKPHIPRIKAAKQQRDRWKVVRDVIRQHGSPLTRAGEQAITQAAAQIDPAYDPSQQPRIEEAKHRLEAVQRLEAVCSLTPVSESDVASAYDAVQSAQADSLMDATTRQRALQASQLAPLLQKLQTIPQHGTPTPQRDQNILSTWNNSLRNCPEASPWLQLREEASQRRTLLQELDQAIADRNDGAIVDLTESPLLTGWPFAAAQSDAIGQARKAIEGARGLVRVLESGLRDQFAQAFDFRVVKDFPSQFQPLMPQIRDWLPTEILPQGRVGLAMPTLGRSAAIQKSFGGPGWSIQWGWPESRFSDQCLVKLTRTVPDPKARPESLQRVMHSLTITRSAYDGGGGRVSIRPLNATANWKNCCVSIWACIEICGETFYSDPLILGRLT